MPTRVLGYYTISPGAIAFSQVPAAVTKKLGRYEVPVFRLGRLAVAVTAQGRGLGSDLLLAAGERALAVAQEVGGVALAIDAKDQYTHQHILRVQRYAVAAAKQMGLTGNELEGLNTGALLHDIGKLGVPEYVLLKPGRLTDEEFEKIKKHPEIGAAILDPVEFPWPVLPVVKYHHERWDGTGYPHATRREEIPLCGRIVALADVYDALTSRRVYKPKLSHETARCMIMDSGGTHFDPDVVAAFARVEEEFLAVRMRYGEVQAEAA